jgi:lipopolysaccharide transport system permease protein
MSETVYDAEPALSRPRRFFLEAAGDLRRSMRSGWTLFRSEMRAYKRRSALGYAWLLLPALTTAILCSYIQARGIVRVAPTALPYPLFVLAGVVFWQTFADALNAPLRQLRTATRLISRTRVPHEAIIVSAVLATLTNAGARLAILIVALLLFGVAFKASWLLLPLGLASIIVLGLALGLLAAPLGLLYEDVGRGLLLVTGLWFFLTPVLYPLPNSGWFSLNPMAPLIEGTRGWLLGASAPLPFFIVAAGAIAALALAWLLYRVARPHVIARVG